MGVRTRVILRSGSGIALGIGIGLGFRPSQRTLPSKRASMLCIVSLGSQNFRGHWKLPTPHVTHSAFCRAASSSAAAVASAAAALSASATSLRAAALAASASACPLAKSRVRARPRARLGERGRVRGSVTVIGEG